MAKYQKITVSVICPEQSFVMLNRKTSEDIGQQPSATVQLKLT